LLLRDQTAAPQQSWPTVSQPVGILHHSTVSECSKALMNGGRYSPEWHCAHVGGGGGGGGGRGGGGGGGGGGTREICPPSLSSRTHTTTLKSTKRNPHDSTLAGMRMLALLALDQRFAATRHSTSHEHTDPQGAHLSSCTSSHDQLRVMKLTPHHEVNSERTIRDQTKVVTSMALITVDDWSQDHSQPASTCPCATVSPRGRSPTERAADA
jgi:hypothetical protein